MPDHQKNCPNCGFPATHNYCAQCGQETHLHKETFGNLVQHFFGHYFHYDSKFWDTLKVLCGKPGALTIAYREQKRARYLHPISVLIFITIFSLITSTIAHKVYDHFDIGQDEPEAQAASVSHDETYLKGLRYWDKAYAVYTDDVKADAIFETMDHNVTAIVFCMIPIFTLLLQVMYFKRKEFDFTDHSIFAFHFHAFLFIALFFNSILPDKLFYWSFFAALIISTLYLIIALRRAYTSGPLSSILIASTIFILYMISFLLLSFLLIFSAIANWQY